MGHRHTHPDHHQLFDIVDDEPLDASHKNLTEKRHLLQGDWRNCYRRWFLCLGVFTVFIEAEQEREQARLSSYEKEILEFAKESVGEIITENRFLLFLREERWWQNIFGNRL